MIKNKKHSLEKPLNGEETVKTKKPKLAVKEKGTKKQKPRDDAADKPSKFDKSTKGPHNKEGRPQKEKLSSTKGGFSKKSTNGNPFANKKKFAGKPGIKKSDGSDKSGAPTEKTDWRKFKQEKKDLKLKRKQSKDSYEISIEAKKIYEKLKCRRTEKKGDLVEKLYNLMSADDLLRKMVMAHDTARIIQCMLKFASPPLREQISEKLLPLAVDMAVSKYSHFCVLRMFKYGSPNIKSKLVDSFFGHIVKLACHNISSKILDHAYLTVANTKQKIHMRQEFYGELYKRTKDENVKELADAYKETPNMKASILGSVKSNLEHVANKQLVDNSLVHAVMLEYLRACDEDKIEETVSAYATLIPLMLTTKDGCQAAIICFYKSTPKNRRAIIKTIKEHLVKICTHEHGHIFILTVLNALDDTKAIKKAIFDNIHPELKTLMSNQWGRRVIEWLINPADTNAFHPTFIASIEEGLQFGKKDKELRRKEIFEQIEEPIANAISEKADFWLSDKHIALVTANILKKLSSSNFEKAAKALASVICDDAWSVNLEEESEKKNKKPQDIEKVIEEATKLKKKKLFALKAEAVATDSDADEGKEAEAKPVNVASVPGIEEAGLHIVLKKIIKQDKVRIAENQDASTFGSIIAEQLTDQILAYWITVNRACFILLNILENNSDATNQMLKKHLKPQLQTLKQQKGTGAQLLLKKISSQSDK